MVNIDLRFNHDGEWIKEPHLLCSKKLVHFWKGYDPDLLSFKDIIDEFISGLGFIGFQQLIIIGPFGTYYEIAGDDSIRKLMSLVSDEYCTIDIFVMD